MIWHLTPQSVSPSLKAITVIQSQPILPTARINPTGNSSAHN